MPAYDTLASYLPAFSVVFLLFVIQSVFLRRSRLPPLPPGPPQSIWSGNFHNYPTDQPWLKLTEWAKIYGPVYHLRMFTSRIIILSSATTALDLLESRSNIYSDRPASVVLGELGERQKTMFRMRAGDPKFKTYRRLIGNGLNPRATASYKPLMESERGHLLRRLLESPEEFVRHVRRNAIALILKVAYGYEIKSMEDRMIKSMEEEFHIVGPKTTSLFAADIFPILRFIPEWFPFAEFKRVARQLRELGKIEAIPFEWAKSQIENGTHVESFTSRLLLSEDGDSPPTPEEQEIIKWCSAALFVGGADTTVSAMTSMFFAMTLFPEVQKRAQEEIDAVIGKERRLPSVEDRESMPYVTAVIKEIVRWATVAPLGLRHRVMQDDVYEGYHIPAGATVVANIWAITHDPNVYPNPEHFDPSRHLSPESEHQPNPFKFVFGFGRRVCPGAHFAEVSLFMNISSILAVFNITKEKDKEGKEIEPDVMWGTGVTRHLKGLRCRITPRSEEARTLIAGA